MYVHRSESPSLERRQFAWEDGRSCSRPRNGRRSSSRGGRKRSSRYSPPRRDGYRRSESRPTRRRGGRGRRSPSRSRSRGRGRSRSRSRGGGGKGGGKQALTCFAYLRGKCQRNDKCTYFHPDEEERRRRLDIIAQQPCKEGARCRHPDCLFVHPGEEPRRIARERSGSRDRLRSRSRSPQVPMMKAVGWKTLGGIPVLEELRVPKLAVDPKSKELLVRLCGTDMNPVNLKQGEGAEVVPYSLSGQVTERVLAFSSTGVVEELSEEARASGKFKEGDKVWFASICDPSSASMQEYCLIDYRVTSLKPRSLSFSDAASIPFAALSAWGGLIGHMQMDTHLLGGGVRPPRFTPDGKGVFLALPGGCAAGSFALQLARRYLNKNNNLTVVASASKPESVEWCKRMGADHVINHDAFDFKEELRKTGIKGFDYVFCAVSPEQYEKNLFAVMNPMGQIASFHGGSSERADLPERIVLHRERMGFKNKFLEADGDVLASVARLFDDPSVGLKSLVTEKFSDFTTETVRKAHGWHSLRSLDRDATGNAVFDFE